MKFNIKKKSGYIIKICLIIMILMSISTGQALSMDRTIEKKVVAAGTGTNVTVIIRNDDIQTSLSMKESIPHGWSLTKISDDADIFKAITNEWLWLTVENNTVKTIKYGITVPSGTTPGIYDINGNITTGEGTTSGAKDTIEVILSPGSGSSSNGNYQTTTPTPTVTATAQITVTLAKQTIAAPVDTVEETSATTKNKLPGFSIMISIGIIATIYILRKII